MKENTDYENVDNMYGISAMLDILKIASCTIYSEFFQIKSLVTELETLVTPENNSWSAVKSIKKFLKFGKHKSSNMDVKDGKQSIEIIEKDQGSHDVSSSITKNTCHIG